MECVVASTVFGPRLVCYYSEDGFLSVFLLFPGDFCSCFLCCGGHSISLSGYTARTGQHTIVARWLVRYTYSMGVSEHGDRGSWAEPGHCSYM